MNGYRKVIATNPKWSKIDRFKWMCNKYEGLPNHCIKLMAKTGTKREFMK